MGLRVCVLGSGSGGNCTLVESEGGRFLIDAARLGQRYITTKLDELGVRLADIDGVFATHMHGDHIDAGVTLPLCRKNEIPLYVHADSHGDLMRRSNKFFELDRAGLLRIFRSEPFDLPGFRVTPFSVPHGSGGWNQDIVGHPVGFRFTVLGNGEAETLAYATDLGAVPQAAEDAMVGADVLVIECNHDVEIERRSDRPKFLVDWVLGPRGHLSNDQSAETVQRVVTRSEGRTKHVVLAHLSRDCNSPELALEVVRKKLEEADCADMSICCAMQREAIKAIVV